MGLNGSIAFSRHGEQIEDYFARKSGRVEKAVFSTLPHQAILLCFTNRCGSTLVAAEASAWGFCGKANHQFNYEMFNSDFVIECCDFNNISSFDEYLSFVTREFTSPLGMFFSKVSIDQLSWLNRIGVFKSGLKDPLILSVVRRNILAQAISFDIAEQTGEWTSFHPKSNQDPSIDQVRVMDRVSYISQLNAEAEVFFNLTNARVIRLTYEDVVENLNMVRDRLEYATGSRLASRQERTLDIRVQGQNRNRQWERQMRASIAEWLPTIRPS